MISSRGKGRGAGTQSLAFPSPERGQSFLPVRQLLVIQRPQLRMRLQWMGRRLALTRERHTPHHKLCRKKSSRNCKYHTDTD